jgi:hypothetical protein
MTKGGYLYIDPKPLAVCCAAILLLGPSPAGAEDMRRLSGAEIKRVVTGKVVTDDVHYTDRFQRGGKYVGVFMNKRRTGAWDVKDDRLCITVVSEPPNCDAFWELRKEPRRLLRGKPEFPTVRDTVVVRSQ